MADGRFIGQCYRCKSEMWLPTSLYESAKHSDHITFYCPYGHPQVFAKGETEADKFRRERDQYAQRVAEWQDEATRQRGLKEAAERQAAASRGQVTKLRNRAGAGVCPCCNRSFRQMALHMKNKHPGFRAEEVA